MRIKKRKIKEEIEEDGAYHCWSCGFIIQQALKPENCPECDSKKVKTKPNKLFGEGLEE